MSSNITNESILNLKLSGIDFYNSDQLMLSLVDIDGKTLINKELSVTDLENIISFNIDELANSFYFITLSSKKEVIDIEKFMIMRYLWSETEQKDLAESGTKSLLKSYAPLQKNKQNLIFFDFKSSQHFSFTWWSGYFFNVESCLLHISPYLPFGTIGY